jgi:hypothetical protein
MTIAQLRDQVAAMPVAANQFGMIDHLTAWIDWQLMPDGADSEAPWLVWDDDGTVLICEGETCRLVIGARREGKWFARAPKARAATLTPQPAEESPVIAE